MSGGTMLTTTRALPWGQVSSLAFLRPSVQPKHRRALQRKVDRDRKINRQRRENNLDCTPASSTWLEVDGMLMRIQEVRHSGPM